MTTELEKQFFDTFGIEKQPILCCWDATNCSLELHYPQIADRQYLELICVLNENTTLDETYYQGASTVKELKKLVLKDLIKTKENFDTKHQVQAMFKGER